MAKNEKNEAELIAKAFEKLLSEGFEELRLERTVWKAEEGIPVVGYLVDQMNIQLDVDDRTWNVYTFLTTRPTKAANRDGDIIDVPAGEEVLVTGTAQIAPVLNRFLDPEVMHEIAIMPKSKEDIGSGKSMWTYRAAVNQKNPPKSRGSAYQMRGGAAPKGELPNGQQFDKKTGEVTDKQTVSA